MYSSINFHKMSTLCHQPRSRKRTRLTPPKVLLVPSLVVTPTKNYIFLDYDRTG